MINYPTYSDLKKDFDVAFIAIMKSYELIAEGKDLKVYSNGVFINVWFDEKDNEIFVSVVNHHSFNEGEGEKYQRLFHKRDDKISIAKKLEYLKDLKC